MAEDKIKFSETLFIIDVEFLNYVIDDIRKHFTSVLGRELPDIELDKFITFLALDSAIPTGEKEIMVLLIHNRETKKIHYCTPSDINKELNNVAFRNNMGEFQLWGLSTEGLTTHEDLFLNLLELTADSPDTRKIILVPFEEIYSERLTEITGKSTNKEFVQFGMNKPESRFGHQWEVLAFPLMQAFGIRSKEIN